MARQVSATLKSQTLSSFVSILVPIDVSWSRMRLAFITETLTEQHGQLDSANYIIRSCQGHEVWAELIAV